MRKEGHLRRALAGLCLLLGGCSGLLGGGSRAELYRFGVQPAEAAPAMSPDAARPVLILFVGANFEPAIDSDRILTVTGNQAAYVARARWVSPAEDLFDDATRRAFDRHMASPRLVRLLGVPHPDYALAIDVRRFEADYGGGAGAPPEVVIETRVRLVRWADRTIVAEWPVVARERARENRVAAIVDAFDRGTAAVVGRIAELTREEVARNPAPVMAGQSRR